MVLSSEAMAKEKKLRVLLLANKTSLLPDHLDEDIDVNDLMYRYTTDVIASAAFGLQVNSVKERDNQFFKMGRSLFTFTHTQRAYFFFCLMFPKLAKVRLIYSTDFASCYLASRQLHVIIMRATF